MQESQSFRWRDFYMKNTVIKPPENGAVDPYFYIIRKGEDEPQESTDSEREWNDDVTAKAIDPVALLTGESFWNMISTQYFPIIQTFKMQPVDIDRILQFENKPCDEIVCSSKIDHEDDLNPDYLLNLETQLAAL